MIAVISSKISLNDSRLPSLNKSPVWIPIYSQIFPQFTHSQPILKPTSTSVTPEVRSRFSSQFAATGSLDHQTLSKLVHGQRDWWEGSLATQSMCAGKSSKSGWLESLMFDLENHDFWVRFVLQPIHLQQMFRKFAESALCEETDFRRNRLRMVSFCYLYCSRSLQSRVGRIPGLWSLLRDCTLAKKHDVILVQRHLSIRKNMFAAVTWMKNIVLQKETMVIHGKLW